MSIDTQLLNTVPMIETGIGCKIESPAITTPGAVEQVDFCFCNFECQYVEPVFVKDGGTTFENDKSTFERRRILAGDTIVFEIFKGDTLFATITDNTYGEFFDFGDFPTQPDVIVFRVDWLLVFLDGSGGSGIYSIKVNETIIGNATVKETRKFNVSLFNQEVANSTVRIESIQNGNINGGPTSFDYTGMNLEKMFRLKARLSTRKPKFEDDVYENGQREFTQIQATVTNSYNLTTLPIPREVIDLLIFDTFLANRIFVTDFRIFSGHHITEGKTFEYSRIPVHPEGIEDPVEFRMSQREIYSVNFIDKKKLPLKRNN